MSDKRQQLSILDQWASGSGQVSRSSERLSEIDQWIDWAPLYAVGRRIDKTGPLGDDERAKLQSTSSAQIDTDADSTRKGGQYYFGYKGHIGVDVGSKLIRSLAFTEASPHDSTQLEALLCGDERAIFGDKAYRNPPLSGSQKRRNVRHRRVRRYVEHPFAAIKNRYGMRWAKTKTKLRNKARFVMSAICWNIERSISWAKKKPKIIPAGAG